MGESRKAQVANALLIYVALVVTVIGAGFGYRAFNKAQNTEDFAKEIHASEVRNCNQIEVLKAGTRVTLERGLKSLPSIRYYHDNPDELANARRQNLALLDVYAPLACDSAGVTGATGPRGPTGPTGPRG
jgi:hypothetical protein